MPPRRLGSQETLGLRSGAIALVVWGAEGVASSGEFLERLERHRPPDAPVLFCGPSPAEVNAAVAACAPADVVLLQAGTKVSSGWIERLRAALRSDSRIAVAQALEARAAAVGERPDLGIEASAALGLDALAAAVAHNALRLRPDAPAGGAGAICLSRAALDLLGGLREEFGGVAAALAELADRCVAYGLRSVLADDALVQPPGVEEGGPPGAAQTPADRRRLLQTQPFDEDWREALTASASAPYPRCLSVAGHAVRPISVTVDARCLTDLLSGTQRVVLRLLLSLAERPDIRLSALLPHDLHAGADDALRRRPAIERVTLADVEAGRPRSDVVHRPHQVTSFEDLVLLPKLGRRLVITQLDQINLRNPTYFETPQLWRDHWELTALALALADHVVFLSRYAAEDALGLDLMHPDRLRVVPPAIEKPEGGGRDEEEPGTPPALSRLDLAGKPFLLVLGADFRHKNRLFALRVHKALRERFGFSGRLVLAGPRVPFGSSAEEEEAFLRANPGMVPLVRRLNEVDEPTREWLIANAEAVLYPSASEGFGLVPFEAALLGTPCLFASGSSLAEVLPERAATLRAWDVEASAQEVARVLESPDDRQGLVQAVAEAAAAYTPAREAEGLRAAYAAALAQPGAARSAQEWHRSLLLVREQQGELERRRAELEELQQAFSESQRRLGEAEAGLRAARAILDDPINRGLVGDHAVVPPELQRAVLAVSMRPALRRAGVGLFRAGRAAQRSVSRRSP